MTIETTAAFDAALETYAQRREAERHNANHGALAASYAALEAGGSRQAHEDAENAHMAEFIEPRAEAFAALLAAPAPTPAALLTKVRLMPSEAYDADQIVAQVITDLRHLAGGSI